MKQEQLVDILVLAKRMGNLFAEVEDLTNQLAESVDRQDEVSIGLSTAMRAEPIKKLAEADHALREQLSELDAEDSVRIRAILNGESSAAQGEMEKMLAAQAVQNIRLHQRLMEKDQIVNRKITRDKSIYQ